MNTRPSHHSESDTPSPKPATQHPTIATSIQGASTLPAVERPTPIEPIEQAAQPASKNSRYTTQHANGEIPPPSTDALTEPNPKNETPTEDTDITPEATESAHAWMDGFNAAADTAGMNEEQVETMLEWLHHITRHGLENDAVQQAQLSKQMQTHLRDEWGLNYQRNLALAQRGLRRVSAKTGDAHALERVLQHANLADDPDILKIFHALGEEHADAPMIGLGHGERLGLSTAAQAKKRLAALNTSHSTHQALYNQHDPQHEEAVKQLRQLYEAAYQT